MVEHFDVAAGFHIERFFHRSALHQYRHVPVQHIDFLLCVSHHAPCSPDARQADDDAPDDDRHTDDADQLDFVFQILYDHNLKLGRLFFIFLAIAATTGTLTALPNKA